MIMAPEFITEEPFHAAVAKTLLKRNDRPPALRFESFAESQSLQIMHVGSYDDEDTVLGNFTTS